MQIRVAEYVTVSHKDLQDTHIMAVVDTSKTY